MKWFSSNKNNRTLETPLKVFNTEGRKLQEFTPLKNHTVKMYSCGPTVYDYAHIGNLRAYVLVDTIKRTLLYNGYDVNNTINLTDFGHLSSDADSGEDKMMKGLKREGMDVSLESMRILSERYIKAFEDDMNSLNILPPTQYARASDYVSEQIKLVKTLEEKGYTYQTSDGVYFDISKFPEYGRLGNLDINNENNESRVAVNPEKKHNSDFALWKLGDLGWDSDWGKGFPGWHIECSAMALATLGRQIDIHTGGIDHVTTHHNGEIAQSECATGKKFANYWIHNEHLSIDDQKIAKSEGNGLTLNDLIEKGLSPLAYRYWLLTSHYRTKVNFSFTALEGAEQALTRLQRMMYADWAEEKGKPNQEYLDLFVEAINNDFDTPKVIAILWEVVKDGSLSAGEKKATILEFDTVLGLDLDMEPEEGLKLLGQVKMNEISDEIRELIENREAARVARNWSESDRIRDLIKQKGYLIEDTSSGARITKV